jgi:hypothetical protein
MAGHLAGGLALAILVAGCAAVDWSRLGRPEPTEAERLVDRADAMVRQGRLDEAIDLYAGVVVEPDRDAVHARALYALARLHLDPERGRPDYRAAHAVLERLCAGYPPGTWRRDADAWRAVLGQLVAHEERAARLEREARQLRTEISARSTQSTRLRAQLGARDAEAARLREEAAKLRTALDRLKQIDLDVDRPR